MGKTLKNASIEDNNIILIKAIFYNRFMGLVSEIRINPANHPHRH